VYCSARRISNVLPTAGDPITFGSKQLRRSVTGSSIPGPDGSGQGWKYRSHRRSLGICCRNRRSAPRSPTGYPQKPPCTSAMPATEPARVPVRVPVQSGCWNFFGGGRNNFWHRGLRRRGWRWRLIGLRPCRSVERVQHKVAVVLHEEPNILGALGVGVPDRLVRRVEHAVAVLLHLEAFDVLAVGARRPHSLAARGQHQVAIFLQGQRVRAIA
jgi:hypothetical protein